MAPKKNTKSKAGKAAAFTPPKLQIVPTTTNPKGSPPRLPVASPDKEELLQKPKVKEEKKEETSVSIGSPVKRGPADFIKKKQELMKRNKASPAKTAPFAIGTNGSPATEDRSHKLYTALLETGEAIAWVADRYKAGKPAYTRMGINSLYANPELMAKAKISVILKKRSVADPSGEWGFAVRNRNGDEYNLSWQFLIRLPEGDEKIELEVRQKWGTQLAVFFGNAEKKEHQEKSKEFSPSPNFAGKLPPNSFSYAGEASPNSDKKFVAGYLFKKVDVMMNIIIPQFHMTPDRVCAEDWVLHCYYGPTLAEEVKLMFLPAPSFATPDRDEDETTDNPDSDLMAAFD